jgi:DNA primase
VSEIRELSEQLDLEYWLDRESIPYKMGRGSSGMQAHIKECPACGDRRWRVYLNAETGAGNCFVCNETYSKLGFVKAHLGGDVPWREVFEHVKGALKEQGWQPKRTTTAAVEIGEVKLPLSFALPTPEGENLVYLEKRGITGETAKFFHLRFCTEGWWNFTNEDGRPSGQKFDNRIIIPVFDLDGSLKTFQGRDITGTSDRKYLFPKMLPGTGRYLYNGQNAVRAKHVVMGEGVFDVMAIKLALDEDMLLRSIVPVGSFGKHLSFGSLDGDDQLGRFRQLKAHGLERVTIMWDGEWRALISALDAAELLRRIGLQVFIALLPSEKDPNEVLPEVVRDALHKARPYTPKLSVEWRLRNPYAAQKRPVKTDCQTA